MRRNIFFTQQKLYARMYMDMDINVGSYFIGNKKIYLIRFENFDVYTFKFYTFHVMHMAIVRILHNI